MQNFKVSTGFIDIKPSQQHELQITSVVDMIILFLNDSTDV